MAFLLDTNTLRLYFDGHPDVVRRVLENLDAVWVSSVVAEEQITGRMSDINKARAPRTSLSLARAHGQFTKTLDDLRVFPLFSYSDAAHSVYQTFSAKALRSGEKDSRIAAQAIAHGMVVVTRNVRDFAAIGASCDDWSV